MPEDTSPKPPPGRVYEVLTPGETLGEYTVDACLSYDILGSLYRVTDADGVAKMLFVLPRILTEDDLFMRRFKDLRDKLSQLNHPAIIGLGDSETIDGRICFTAEAVSGKSIPEQLGAAGIYPTYKNPQGVVRAQPSEESKDFTPEKVRKVAQTMLEALEHAHARSTLHLNLTPSNVILTDSGEAKVVGFGLYSIIGQASIEALVSAGIPAVSLGPRNVRLNTADIISPEVHLKQEPDARTDIYAFGMSVYWMLTGLKPSSNYRPPSGIVPGLEPGWDIFLARCLAREKAKRYPGAAAALKDLANLAHLTTGGYANDPKRVQKSAFKTRRQIIVAAVVAAALAIAATLAFTHFSGDGSSGDHVPPGSTYVRAGDSHPPAFVFKCNREGVRVIATQNNASFVLTDGELAIRAPIGRSRFTLFADNSTPRTLSLNYDGKKPLDVPVSFSKTTGAVEISSAPLSLVRLESAARKLDTLGVTGSDGLLVASGVPAGKYTLVVEKDSQAVSRIADFEVKAGVKTTRNVVVEGQTTSLVLESIPEGAQISVDGLDAGTAPLTIDKLKPGTKLNVVFSRSHYRPVTRTIVIDAKDKMVVSSGRMMPAKGTIRYGLTFAGKPADASLLAAVTVARNDDQFTRRSWTEAMKLPKEVAVGHYLLRVEHPDYVPFQTAFLVEDDKTTEVAVPLRAMPSPLALTVTPERTPYTLRVNQLEYQNQPPATVPAETPLHLEVEMRDHELWTLDTVGKPRRPLVVNAALQKLRAPTSGKSFTLPYLGIRMVWVPAGTVRLGSPASEAGRAAVDGPFTWVTFSKGFWMSATEISQGEFERVLGINPSRYKKGEYPVDSVTYADAVRFCKAINDRELRTERLPFGLEYRLPNEVEWEYACRAGASTAFSFGDSAAPKNGNFLGAYPATGETVVRPETGTPRAVASFPPNAYGLYDMHGNVREWVIEQYKPHLPGGQRTDYNVRVVDTLGSKQFTRGGSFRMSAGDCRSGARPPGPLKPDIIEDDIGFRIVLGPSPLP